MLLREPSLKMVLPSYYFAHTLKGKAENIGVHNSMFTGFVMSNPGFLPPWFCSWIWVCCCQMGMFWSFPPENGPLSPYSPSSCSSLPLFTKCWILDSNSSQRGRSRRGWYFLCLEPSMSQHCRDVISMKTETKRFLHCFYMLRFR